MLPTSTPEQQFATLEKRVLAREATIKQRGETIAKLELDLKSLGAHLSHYS